MQRLCTWSWSRQQSSSRQFRSLSFQELSDLEEHLWSLNFFSRAKKIILTFCWLLWWLCLRREMDDKSFDALPLFCFENDARLQLNQATIIHWQATNLCRKGTHHRMWGITNCNIYLGHIKIDAIISFACYLWGVLYKISPFLMLYPRVGSFLGQNYDLGLGWDTLTLRLHWNWTELNKCQKFAKLIH